MKTTLTIDQCVNQFIAEQQIVPGSAITYRANLMCFFKWCDISKIDKRNINLAEMVLFSKNVNEKYSAKYARSIIITLKKYYRFMEKYGYSDNVCEGLKIPKNVERFKKRPLTKEDKAALIAKFKDKTAISKKRDYLIIELMLTSGLRCNEVAGLSVDDLYQDDGVWSMKIKRKCHQRNDDWIAVDHVIDDIEEYIQELNTIIPGFKYLFISFSPRRKHLPLSASGIGKIVKGYLDSKYSAHCLRHTAACDLLDNNFSFDEVSSLLGHANIETTKLYTKYAIDRRKRQNNTAKYLKSKLKY